MSEDVEKKLAVLAELQGDMDERFWRIVASAGVKHGERAIPGLLDYIEQSERTFELMLKHERDMHIAATARLHDEIAKLKAAVGQAGHVVRDMCSDAIVKLRPEGADWEEARRQGEDDTLLRYELRDLVIDDALEAIMGVCPPENDVLKDVLAKEYEEGRTAGRAELCPWVPDAGVVIATIGGNCPVQAEGEIDGVEFYFRARGARWSIGVGGEPVGEPEWEYGEDYGVWPEAGWMPEAEARRLIGKAAALWRRHKLRSECHAAAAGNVPQGFGLKSEWFEGEYLKARLDAAADVAGVFEVKTDAGAT